jgi:hypothetical protein
MRASVKAAQAAAAAISGGDIESAEKALQEAAAKWPGNEMTKRLQTRLASVKAAAPAKKAK